jgi:hypothetical protein
MRNQWLDILKTVIDLAVVTVILILIWPLLKILNFLF